MPLVEVTSLLQRGAGSKAQQSVSWPYQETLGARWTLTHACPHAVPPPPRLMACNDEKHIPPPR